MIQPRPFHEWHEDHGDVIWWLWPIEQAPWIGTPLDLGLAVSFDITVQIGIDVFELQPQKVGDTGGWPWADADDEMEARLFWTPLPDGNTIDEAIRDYIRGGPDPLKDPPVVVSDGLEEGRAAIAVLTQSLSEPQKRLLCRLQPHGPADGDGQDFTYVVETRGVGLDTCAALARRGIMVGGEGYSYQNRNRGYCRLTRLGLRIREQLLAEGRDA